MRRGISVATKVLPIGHCHPQLNQRWILRWNIAKGKQNRRIHNAFDQPRPNSRISKEDDKLFKKDRVFFDLYSAMVGLGVGFMVSTVTYIYFKWRQYEKDKRKAWIVLNEQDPNVSRSPDAHSSIPTPTFHSKGADINREKESELDVLVNDGKGVTIVVERESEPNAKQDDTTSRAHPFKIAIASFPNSLEDFMSFPYPVYSIFIWTTAATLTTLFAWSRGKWMWYRRHFMGRVNFSLNSIQNGTLTFRTLFERSLYDMMYRNQAAVKLVGAAARKTAPGQPFLMIPPDENWYVLNNVLNEISSTCSVGFLQADNGVGITRTRYVFGLTCEKEKVWSRKLRVMLVREDLLKQIHSMDTPQFENGYHYVRWKTLKAMAELYQQQQFHGGPKYLGELELCIPHGVGTSFGHLRSEAEERELREEEEIKM